MTQARFAALGEVCSITTGGTPARTQPGYFDGGIPWVKIGDMANGVVRHTEETLSQSGLDNSSAKIFPRGTVLVSIFATIGRTAILELDAATNQAIAGITPSEAIDSNYLRYYLDSKHSELNSLARGVAQPNINQRILRSLQIPLSSLPEQRRIVDRLSRAEGIVRLRREAQRKAAELVPALFLDMFGNPASNPKGWPVVALGELLSESPVLGTMAKPSAKPARWLDLRVANIQDGQLTLEDRKWLDLREEEIERFALGGGDVLLARAIGSLDHLGKAIVVYPTGEWTFDSHLMRVRLDQELLLPIVFKAFLESEGGRKEFLSYTRQSAVQFNINGKELRKIRIPVPRIELQHQFAAKADAVLAIASQQAAALATAQATFDALLHQAFTLR